MSSLEEKAREAIIKFAKTQGWEVINEHDDGFIYAVDNDTIRVIEYNVTTGGFTPIASPTREHIEEAFVGLIAKCGDKFFSGAKLKLDEAYIKVVEGDRAILRYSKDLCSDMVL